MKEVFTPNGLSKHILDTISTTSLGESISNREILNKIEHHQLIIITGTSEGRSKLRTLILNNLGPKRIIKTRSYRQYTYPWEEMTEKQKKNACIVSFETKNPSYDYMKRIVDVWKKKKLPVIIDSWSDVEFELKQSIKYNTLEEWKNYENQLQYIIGTLLKNKKKLILFVDWKKQYDLIDGVPENVGFRPVCSRKIQHISDLILLCKDDKVCSLHDAFTIYGKKGDGKSLLLGDLK